MSTFLLIIIYLAFISLGLPDSLLGAAWPKMQPDYGAELETAGFLFMMIAGGTIISSLISGKVLKRFGTGKVTFVSVLMTAGALLGFYFAPSISWVIVCAIPLGLGAGAVDAGLNDFVAANYRSHHMSWLHCFWGVGATLGPIIMSWFILEDNSWRSGYFVIAGIQFLLVIILFVTLPLWNRVMDNSGHSKNKEEVSKDVLNEAAQEYVRPLQIKGVKLAMAAFLLYCAIEAMIGLWGSSFLVNIKGLSTSTAAGWISFYYAGITVGRFLTGFITFKYSNRTIIRTGQWIALAGAIILMMPLPPAFALTGFIIIGFGLAPIFPCMLHETPARFGKKHSQTIMGYQMALAYTGTTFVPPLVGLAASYLTIGVFPFWVVIFVVFMLLVSEKINNLMKNNVITYKSSDSDTTAS